LSARSLLPVFVGGCVGGFAQSFTASPMELLKVRLQLSHPAVTRQPGGGIAVAAAGGRGLATTSSIVKELTAVGHSHTLPPLLSQGLLATLARDVVPHGVWFASYEAAKAALTPERSPPLPASLGGAVEDVAPPLSMARQLAAGSAAAVVAWGVGYPFDIVKTRCQMSPSALGFAAATAQVSAHRPAAPPLPSAAAQPPPSRQSPAVLPYPSCRRASCVDTTLP
jgi:solute carrier family 25 carnitine/acylcarnitine transporter 20/29